MNEEFDFDDYNASQITPQYTLLKKLNKILDWLKGTTKNSIGIKLYKHIITTNSLSIKNIQFVSTERLGDFSVESVLNALKKMVGVGYAYCNYPEYAGWTCTTIYKDLPTDSSKSVDGIWGVTDSGNIYNFVQTLRNSTIMTHSIIDVD